MDEWKLSSMSFPPSQRVVDSTKLTNTNSQSKTVTDFKKSLSPSSSGEDIKAESTMDSSDYTGVEPRSSLNRCDYIEERAERTNGYFMSREEKDTLNQHEGGGGGGGGEESVKMEGMDDVRDGFGKEEEKQGHVK